MKRLILPLIFGFVKRLKAPLNKPSKSSKSFPSFLSFASFALLVSGAWSSFNVAPAKGVTVKADKLTQALNWSPLAEEGKVILVRGPWNREFIEEVCQFPGGRFDDQVDAVSLAVTMFRDRGKGLRTFS